MTTPLVTRDKLGDLALEVDPRALAIASAALRQRLLAAYAVVANEETVHLRRIEPDSADHTTILDALVGLLIASRRSDVAWLLYATLSTVLPSMADVESIVRAARFSSVVELRLWLLGVTLPMARSRGRMHLHSKIKYGGYVVDVNFSATDEHNSGIQRVVRRTVPHWLEAGHDIELVAWGVGGMRSLNAREIHRVTQWDSPRVGDDGTDDARLVIPWQSTVVLAEVPSRAYMCDPIACIGRYSGSRLGLIGYDAIPIVSAESVPVDMADHFAKYLTVVKWSTAVAAISTAAADEFKGFAAMLPAQGLAGPVISACPLPADPVRPLTGSVRERPLIAVIGSKEPRKNHVAVLYAAERLWREGLDFELLFIGIFGWDTRVFRSWFARLTRAGRPISAPARVGDDELWRTYADARFTVFPSLHEGYGLPVAESLAYGTPVITTAYGSTGEIAAAGGCVVVDPRDDEQIVDAMRRLLTDDVELERLRAEARGRPPQSWSEYAARVWGVIGVAS